MATLSWPVVRPIGTPPPDPFAPRYVIAFTCICSDLLSKITCVPFVSVYAAEKFEGVGMQFPGKLIGIMDVPELKGDKMCFEAMQALKAEVRRRGEHKPRIAVGVSFDGIAIHGMPTGVRAAATALYPYYTTVIYINASAYRYTDCTGHYRRVGSSGHPNG